MRVGVKRVAEQEVEVRSEARGPHSPLQRKLYLEVQVQVQVRKPSPSAANGGALGLTVREGGRQGS